MTNESIIEIPLDRVIESPSNPRKLFNEDYLQELATDIKAHGRVLQPIVVREVRDPNDERATIAEIVFGHCRTRAARLDYGHEAALLKDYKAKSVDTLSPDELGRLIVECCVIEQSQAESYDYETEPKALHALAEHHGIDVKALRAGKATKTPTPAGAATDNAPIVDDKTLPLALEGGSMHRELAIETQSQADDAASPLSEAVS